ncbi:hypothetical protein ECANGB1_833 [Enterospora canceri]|uniref:Uncharacterized protein n=1 Tax=Enterospora canceri TaxID=1081671 RepID=A0A1Y1S834_9MICR|nr:hypothetical protein ECANGB1_833 [Enterospora canceri]
MLLGLLERVLTVVGSTNDHLETELTIQPFISLNGELEEFKKVVFTIVDQENSTDVRLFSKVWLCCSSTSTPITMITEFNDIYTNCKYTVIVAKYKFPENVINYWLSAFD